MKFNSRNKQQMSGFGVGTVELYSKTSAYCFLQFERHYREFMIALNIADWIDTEQFQNICRWNFSSISFCKDKKLFNFFWQGIQSFHWSNWGDAQGQIKAPWQALRPTSLDPLEHSTWSHWVPYLKPLICLILGKPCGVVWVLLGVNTLYNCQRRSALSWCIYLQCGCKVSKTWDCYERKLITRLEALVRECLLKPNVCHSWPRRPCRGPGAPKGTHARWHVG